MAFRIGYRDYWSQGTILATYSSAHPQWPPTDTQVDIVSQAWRTAPATTSGWIDCDILNATAIDMFAILGHNYTSGATIAFYGADDAGFSSNVVTETVTWVAGSIFGFFSTPRTKRYWRLSISNASNTDGFLQTGVIKLYASWTPSRPYLATYQPGQDTASTVNISGSRDILGASLPVLGIQSLPFAGMTNSDLATFLDFQAYVDILNAFVIVFDDSAPATNSKYAYLTELTVPEPQWYNYVNFVINFREAAQ